jgi:hypothetical protein
MKTACDVSLPSTLLSGAAVAQKDLSERERQKIKECGRAPYKALRRPYYFLLRPHYDAIAAILRDPQEKERFKRKRRAIVFKLAAARDGNP